ncbi:phage protein Gp27 family protein [Telmatospirillum sp. J64-1]|uniref:phage protein Gp27 family protein n=1 Tax=Telmatospirillum sp. J64-1 TaxID=2502183 RepID=UPI00115DA396|nr:phage protein Gp27 family protein [Telmatospirillum sp. J64-1]
MAGHDKPAGNPHGNRSAIEMALSPSDKTEFDRLLGTGRLTLDGLVLWLEGKGYEISRSSVHRYKGRFDRMAARLRQSREVTQALARELGDAAEQGQQGRVLVEMARTLVFDMMDSLPENAQLDPKDIALLGKGLAEMAKAARMDQDFETKVEEARAKAKRDAASTAATAARAAGLTDELARQIEAKILGVES